MKPPRTTPQGPRIIPKEEYKACGLDCLPLQAEADFFRPFIELQKQFNRPAAPIYCLTYVDGLGSTKHLGQHSGTLQEVANKIQTGSVNLDAEYDPETGQIYIVRFSPLGKTTRFPVSVKAFNGYDADYRNMNKNPLPLAPKQPDLGLSRLPKQALVMPDPKAKSIPGPKVASVLRAQAADMDAKAKAKRANRPDEYGTYLALAKVMDKVEIVWAWAEVRSDTGGTFLALAPDGASLFHLRECIHSKAPSVPVYEAVLAGAQ